MPTPDSAVQPQRILIVEDDADIAYLLRFIFDREGFVVETAADGHIAGTRLLELPVPDALVLDIMLPHVDGLDLLRQMRALPGWDKAPILMLTAKGREDDIVRALDAGANDYVIKPFQPQEVVARIRRLLRSSR
jgi:two-component system, OmpR family, alkaline phosphatase synthesis response regulator PhoP